MISDKIRYVIREPEDTLPAKNMEYFLFHRFFCFLLGVQGVSILEIHSYEQILLLMKLISTHSKMKRKGSKTITSAVFSIRLWLEFLLSLVRLLPYPFVCYKQILCTIPLFIYRLFWCGQQGISVMGAAHHSCPGYNDVWRLCKNDFIFVMSTCRFSITPGTGQGAGSLAIPVPGLRRAAPQRPVAKQRWGTLSPCAQNLRVYWLAIQIEDCRSTQAADI